VETY
jgi:hypothetical protein